MNKYEKLIEYVINDQPAKAQELFHQIVIEASRTIYEDMMDLAEQEECESFGGDASDSFMQDVETDEENLGEEEEDFSDEEELDFDSDFGDEEVSMDFDSDDEYDDEISTDSIEDTVGDYKVASDKVVDLEDKLDALMAEFEALMSDSESEIDFDSEDDDFGDDDYDSDYESDSEEMDFDVDGGDELETDDTEEFISERESTNKRDNRAEKAGRKVAKDIEWDERKKDGIHGKRRGKEDSKAERAGRKVAKDIEWDEKHDRFDENVKLQAAPKPVTTEPEGTNKKSINANNSGAVGAVTKPVKMVGDTAHGRSNPKVGNLPDAGKFKNVPSKDNSKLSAAPKPVTSQASGVNSRTPFPKD